MDHPPYFDSDVALRSPPRWARCTTSIASWLLNLGIGTAVLIAGSSYPCAARELWVAGETNNSWVSVSEEMDNLEDASGWLQPIDVSGQNLTDSAIRRRGWVDGTHFADEPHLFGINGTLDAGWGISATATRDVWARDFVVGRDKSGNVRISTEEFQDVTVIVDLGARFGVDSLSVISRLGKEDRFIKAFQVFVNDGQEIFVPPPGEEELGFWESWFPIIQDWPLLATVERVEEDRVGLRVPVTNVRYVAFNDNISLPDPEGWEIDEFQLWGAGYVLSADYVSEVINLGQESFNLGDIRWEVSADPGATVEIRTRTGQTAEPNLYFERTGRGLSGVTEVTRQRYRSLQTGQRAGVILDSENWDEWSAPYPATGQEPIRALGPRSAFQFQVGFRSDSPLARARVDLLSLEYSTDRVARSVVGEVLPEVVEPGEVNRLQYSLRAALGPGDTGFDGLRIRAPIELDQERLEQVSLNVNGITVPSTVQLESDGFSVLFPGDPVRFTSRTDTTTIDLTFDARVFLHGTRFSGEVFDSVSDDVAQDVLPGDASPVSDTNDLQVAWDLNGELITAVEVEPATLTPNGDGVNEVMRISYSLLQLLVPSQVKLEIFDLAGRAVFTDSELRSTGRYSITWDGRTGDQLVPPGSYLYRLVVDNEQGSDAVTGIVAVAY